MKYANLRGLNGIKVREIRQVLLLTKKEEEEKSDLVIER
jgi:hypothetical protein